MMLKLINPAGSFTFVHESRIDEYLARGYKLTPPPSPAPAPAKPAPAKKKTTKKQGG